MQIYTAATKGMGCGSAVLKEILQNKYGILQLKFWGNIWLLQAHL